MTALLTAVFIASLVGSLHCAGMCGPLMACAVARPESKQAQLGGGFARSVRWSAWWSRSLPQLAYHLGRLTGYALLGALAGAAGAMIDLATGLAGLQPVAVFLAAGAMIVMGVALLGQARGWRVGLPLPRWWTTLATRAQGFALRFHAGWRALAIGLLTPLLPCGWLYAFVLTAAGTRSAAGGAAVMAVFWLGTLPVLVALGVGIQGVLGLTGRRVPTLTAVALIVLGLLTLTGRMQLDPVAMAAQTQSQSQTQTDREAGPVVPDAAQTPACCAAEKSEADAPPDSEPDGGH